VDASSPGRRLEGRRLHAHALLGLRANQIESDDAMRRPIYVKQREDDDEDGMRWFWFTVQGGNAENVLTSKMFMERWRAVRGARAFIKSVSPAPVEFWYWTGRKGRMRMQVESHGSTLLNNEPPPF
jgi:hypothetical protein